MIKIFFQNLYNRLRQLFGYAYVIRSYKNNLTTKDIQKLIKKL